MSKHSKKKTKIAQHRLESYGNILSDNLLKNTNNDSYIADSLFYKTDEDRLVKQENAQNDIQQLKTKNENIIIKKFSYLISLLISIFTTSFVLFIKILRDIDFNNTINININTALQLIFTFSISFPISSLLHRIIFKKNQKNWKTKYPILLKSATDALNIIHKGIKYKDAYYNSIDISEINNVMLFALSQLTICPIYQTTNYWNEYATTIELTANFNEDEKEIIFNIPFPPKNCIYKEKSCKYNVSRDSYKTQYITNKDWNDIYKKILCSISLLCCNTIFQFDHQKMIDKIYINGFINCINDNTGKEEDCFLILLQTSREKLLSETIDLSSVNPVSCCKEYFDVKMEKNFINPSFKLKPYQFTE